MWCGSEVLIWGFLARKLNGKLRTKFSKLDEGQTAAQTSCTDIRKQSSLK